MRERLLTHLESAWREADVGPAPEGVIFASTKGEHEDFIRTAVDRDPYSELLDAFLARVGLFPRRRLVVSNACASSHVAIVLARRWLHRMSNVLVLAADGIGPFVETGFRSLGALSPTRVRPFSADRDGLQLGEGAAALLFSKSSFSDLAVSGAATETDGQSVTRPSTDGESLRRVSACALGGKSPDFVLAHGTGTVFNDQAEGKVFETLCPLAPVTATKWSIGHTMGASGALDLIAAAEAMRRGRLFNIGNTPVADPKLGASFLHASAPPCEGDFRRALVTSLGFGGVHAAVVLERTES